MNLPRDRLLRTSSSLVEFFKDAILVEVVIILPVTAFQAPKQATVMLNFMVVRVPSAYNVILGDQVWTPFMSSSPTTY